MSWQLPVSGSDFDRPQLPGGLYVARCVLLFDIGTQPGGRYGPKHKLIVGWELPENVHVFDEQVGPEPIFLSKFFGATMSAKSHLRPFLEAWRGARFTDEQARGFDITQILGQPCFLNVMPETKSDGEVFSKVTGVARIDAHTAPNMPAQVGPTRCFLFRQPNADMFDAMPEWMRKMAAESAEYAQWINAHRPIQHQPVQQTAPPAAQNAPVTDPATPTSQPSFGPPAGPPATQQPATTMVSGAATQPVIPTSQQNNPHFVPSPGVVAPSPTAAADGGPVMDPSTSQLDPNRAPTEDEIPF